MYFQKLKEFPQFLLHILQRNSRNPQYGYHYSLYNSNGTSGIARDRLMRFCWRIVLRKRRVSSFTCWILKLIQKLTVFPQLLLHFYSFCLLDEYLNLLLIQSLAIDFFLFPYHLCACMCVCVCVWVCGCDWQGINSMHSACGKAFGGSITLYV